MNLKFTGGIRPAERTRDAKKPIEYINDCSDSCLLLPKGSSYVCDAKPDSRVKCGTSLGVCDGTTVYSPISGVFKGLIEIQGKDYLVVTSDNECAEESFVPEERALGEIPQAELVEAIKRLAVKDVRTGEALWKTIERAARNCRRVIVDCTESDALCAISYRLCIEKSESVIGGLKILLRALGAGKGVIVSEYYRVAAAEALAIRVSDPTMIAFAAIDEKYPYSDRTVMEAVYMRELAAGESSADAGCLIVGAETAAAVYDCIATGHPHTGRYISVCGNGIEQSGNLCVPDGMTVSEILSRFGGLQKNCFAVENSLISGHPVGGAVTDSTRAIVTAGHKKKHRLPCIDCGICASVCPVRLLPFGILVENSAEASDVINFCIGCGCCEYACPSGIPLARIIAESRNGGEATEVVL